MGSEKRKDNILKMKEFLNLSDSDIFLDDRPNGGHALYTARKTWELPFNDDTTHRCVLQDDLEVCDGEYIESLDDLCRRSLHKFSVG